MHAHMCIMYACVMYMYIESDICPCVYVCVHMFVVYVYVIYVRVYCIYVNVCAVVYIHVWYMCV